MHAWRVPLLVVLGLLTAGAARGQGWQWLHPWPQGNDLSDVAFSDSLHAWAVGAGGTILRSTDAGWTWQFQPSGTRQNLKSLCFADSVAYAVGDSGTVVRSTDGGLSWTVLPQLGQDYHYGVFFVSPARGWIVGGGWDWNGPCTLYRTINGGETWTESPPVPPPDGRALSGVYFLNDTLGWVTGALGRRYHTTDGGETWTDQSGPWNAGILYDVQFLTDSTGWTVGSQGKVMHTRTGGASWHEHDVEFTREELRRLHFADTSHGWALGEDSLYRTTDAGETWTAQAMPRTALRGLAFGPGGSGLACGTWGMFFRSLNNGQSWEPRIQEFTRGSMRGVAFAHANRGWVVGDSGRIMSTSNGGASWMSVVPPPNSPALYDITCQGTDSVWVVGDASTLLMSTDGGIYWENPLGLSSHFLRAIDFADAQHGVAVGLNYKIITSEDGGLNWTQRLVQGVDLFGVDMADAQTACAVGADGTVLWTIDGGETWVPQIVDQAVPLNDVCLVDASTGWAVGHSGTILHTTDSGANWLLQPSGVNTALHTVVFIDALNGWVAGESGTLLATTDGGESWAREETHATVDFLDLAVYRNGNELRRWAVGERAAILRHDSIIADTPPGRAPALPADLALCAFPNPFNPAARLTFTLPAAGPVTLRVFDITGRLVTTLANGVLAAGPHHLTFDGTGLSSGLYFARLETAHESRAQKLMLLK